MSPFTPERLDALASAAVAAPSADNRHVVRLSVRDGFLELLARQELRSSGRLRWLLGLVSAGAVAENMILRGRRHGLQLEPRWLPEGPGGEILVRFDCREAEPGSNPLEALIEQRHTNRRMGFRGPPLAREQQQILSTDAASVGAALSWLDGATDRKAALRLIGRAETERFSNFALHQELFSSIRFGLGWRSTGDEGLPPATLELPLIERPAFQLLRRWPVQRLLNLAGTHRFVGFRAAYLPCWLAPHLGAISAPGDADESALAVGRALQRVWLRATAFGMAFQVFAASAIYAQEGIEQISPALRRQLQAGWESLGLPDRPVAVFRMGRAAAPTARTGRPSPRQLLA